MKNRTFFIQLAPLYDNQIKSNVGLKIHDLDPQIHTLKKNNNSSMPKMKVPKTCENRKLSKFACLSKKYYSKVCRKKLIGVFSSQNKFQTDWTRTFENIEISKVTCFLSPHSRCSRLRSYNKSVFCSQNTTISQLDGAAAQP